jgi:hypothetical protein
VEDRTSVQRLVDTMLDRAEAVSPDVEYDIWIPSLESLLLPRDAASTAPSSVHRYRGHRVQPFDTVALTVWVSPAGGVVVLPGAPSYVGDPVTGHITVR